MSLTQRITDLHQRVAAEFKSHSSAIAGNETLDLSGLSTVDKSSLLAAVNELFASVTQNTNNIRWQIESPTAISTTDDVLIGSGGIASETLDVAGTARVRTLPSVSVARPAIVDLGGGVLGLASKVTLAEDSEKLGGKNASDYYSDTNPQVETDPVWNAEKGDYVSYLQQNPSFNQQVVATRNIGFRPTTDATTALDLNVETRPWIHQFTSSQNWLNRPKNGYFNIQTIKPRIGDFSGMTQIAHEFTPTGPRMYLRNQYTEGIGWSDWEEVYHTGNPQPYNGPWTVSGDNVSRAVGNVIFGNPTALRLEIPAVSISAIPNNQTGATIGVLNSGVNGSVAGDLFIQPRTNVIASTWIYGQGNPIAKFQYDGNVGIGTTNPTAKLHIDGSTIINNNLMVGVLTTDSRIQTNGQVKFGEAVSPVRINSTSTTSIIEGSSSTNHIFRATNANAEILMEIGAGNKEVVINDQGVSVKSLEDVGSAYLEATSTGVLQRAVVQPYSPSNPQPTNWTQSGNNIYSNNTGNVGIGTTNPTAKLDVRAGDIQLDNSQYYRSSSSTGVSTRMLGINAGNVAYVGPIDDGPTIMVYAPASTITNTRWTTLGVESMRLTSTGLGIGTTNPTEKLHVEGGRIRVRDVSSDHQLVVSQASSSTSRKAGILYQIDAVDLWKTYVDNSDGNRFKLDGNGVNALSVNASNRNVGIGTTNPTEKLHVVGSNYVNVNTPIDVIRVTSRDVVPSNSGGLTFGGYWNNIITTGRKAFIQSSEGLDAGGVARDLLLNPEGGSVGIGTTNPTAKLHVEGGSVLISRPFNGIEDALILRSSFGGVDEGKAIRFNVGGGVNGAKIIGQRDGSAGGKLVFQTSTTFNVEPTTKMVIDDNGNVIINSLVDVKSDYLEAAPDGRLQRAVVQPYSPSNPQDAVATIVPGFGVSVDSTDPANPVLTANTNDVAAKDRGIVVIQEDLGVYQIPADANDYAVRIWVGGTNPVNEDEYQIWDRVVPI